MGSTGGCSVTTAQLQLAASSTVNSDDITAGNNDVHLPVHASWLNQIEIYFARYAADRADRGRVHDSRSTATGSTPTWTTSRGVSSA